jgi:hypothetical protein
MAKDLSPAEFNGMAKELREEDDLLTLQKLAVARIGEPRNEELGHALAQVACAAVVEWWSSGGNCHKGVRTKLQAAARNFRGDGGHRVDIAWRGGYYTAVRQCSTPLSGHLPAPAKRETPQEAAVRSAEWARAAEPKDSPADELGDDDAFVEAVDTGENPDDGAEREAERPADAVGHRGDVFITTGVAVVAGATRGLRPGRMQPQPYLIALQMAVDERPGADSAFLGAIGKAGGLENYVAKDANRKRHRAALESQYLALQRALRNRALAIVESAGDVELQAAWMAVQTKERGYRAVGIPRKYRVEPITPPPLRGISRVRGGVIDGGKFQVSRTDLAAAVALAQWRKASGNTRATLLPHGIHDTGRPVALSKWRSWDAAGHLMSGALASDACGQRSTLRMTYCRPPGSGLSAKKKPSER